MLSDVDLYELKDKMRIQPTLKCKYKDHLKNFTFKPEEAYIINLADEANPDNFGTHYCLLYSVYNKQLPKKLLEYFLVWFLWEWMSFRGQCFYKSTENTT